PEEARPWAGPQASTSRTLRPAARRRCAVQAPNTPAPITTMSASRPPGPAMIRPHLLPRTMQGRKFGSMAEALAEGEPDHPRLPDIVAEPRPAAALAVEREQGILVEQIADIEHHAEPVVPIHAGVEVDVIIGRQLEVDDRRRIAGGAAERQARDEAARIVLLVA